MIFILMIGLLVVSKARGNCPDGFVQFRESCYHFSHSRETWMGAQVACKEAFFPTKANLVKIDDQAENQFLFRQAQATRTEYWIGASDLQVKGVYRWLNSGQEVGTYFNFWIYSGNPSGGPEHCMEISLNTNNVPFWNDQTCTDFQHFICETAAK
ncbi:perlucin-like [Dreissena polymorpha]|uniref:C-type lectin domain-containing protein n=1 Tax=Dreissena polymorpha TaxID=45954 RepID=A0A9D4KC72_DREPO|nr:perlucin-like [Dreissena polymorpha]XP_052276794.1 perlucin-like [Dreissena polymorpha]KAH3836853.1 hypothetical protein DPMN_110229 [Dreissena polymorpha]